jgi:hypothetical protein
MSSVVINTRCGGFDLSEAAKLRLGEEYRRDTPRNSRALVEVVREMGAEADGPCASLTIVELPPGKYVIADYDGAESICQYHLVLRGGRWKEEGIVVTVPSPNEPKDRLARLREEVEIARLEAELRELRGAR